MQKAAKATEATTGDGGPPKTISKRSAKKKGVALPRRCGPHNMDYNPTRCP